MMVLWAGEHQGPKAGTLGSSVAGVQATLVVIWMLDQGRQTG